MTVLDDEFVQQLKTAGLIVGPPFSATHSLAFGRWIFKSDRSKGNSIADYEFSFSDGIAVAPPILLLPKDGEWYVWQHEHCPPNTARGDFENRWSTPQEAIDDIVDFYFGDPQRMENSRDRRPNPSNYVQPRKGDYSE